MMQKEGVTHLDLDILVHPTTTSSVQKALELFKEHFHYQVIDPRLRNGHLLINSKDFIEFLAHFDPQTVTEFELRGILRDAERQMKIWLQKSIVHDIKYHYNWCLTALKNFEVGRNISRDETITDDLESDDSSYHDTQRSDAE